MAKYLSALILALLLLPFAASARGEAPAVGGFLKTLDIFAKAPPASGSDDGFLSSNNLRLDFTGEHRRISWEVSAESQLLYTNPAGTLPLPSHSLNQALDLHGESGRGEHFASRWGIDRLSLKSKGEPFEWSLGRQAIGFGRITLFSPLDVIAPFPPDTLDSDVRPGVDALRAARYFGLGGQIGGTAVLGDNRDHHSYLAIFSTNTHEIDILAMAGSLRRRPMAGLGLAGALGPLGLKAEAAAYKGVDVDRPDGDPEDTFVIAAAEAWYRFDLGLVLLIEYLHNGAGASDPARYPAAFFAAPFNEGLVPFAGHNYLLIAPSYELHPLVTAFGVVIWNLGDDSALVRPQLAMSLSDNCDLTLIWALHRGEKAATTPLGPVLRSEYGSAGDSVGGLLRWFF